MIICNSQFFSNLQSKKSLIAPVELCAHEYEYTSHIVALYISYAQRPYGFILYGRYLFCPLSGKKRG